MDKRHTERSEIGSRGLTNLIKPIIQPIVEQVTHTMVKELFAELLAKNGNLLDDSEAHSPLFVLSQLNNGLQLTSKSETSKATSRQKQNG